METKQFKPSLAKAWLGKMLMGLILGLLIMAMLLSYIEEKTGTIPFYVWFVPILVMIITYFVSTKPVQRLEVDEEKIIVYRKKGSQTYSFAEYYISANTHTVYMNGIPRTTREIIFEPINGAQDERMNCVGFNQKKFREIMNIIDRGRRKANAEVEVQGDVLEATSATPQKSAADFSRIEVNPQDVPSQTGRNISFLIIGFVLAGAGFFMGSLWVLIVGAALGILAIARLAQGVNYKGIVAVQPTEEGLIIDANNQQDAFYYDEITKVTATPLGYTEGRVITMHLTNGKKKAFGFAIPSKKDTPENMRIDAAYMETLDLLAATYDDRFELLFV